MPNIDQINLGSSLKIIDLPTLPTGATSYSQHTILRVADEGGRLYRTLKFKTDFSDSAQFEVYVQGEEILEVTAVGGSSATKVGDVVAGVTVALGDLIVVASAGVVSLYKVGLLAADKFYDLDRPQEIHTSNDQVYAYNHQNTSLVRLDTASATYNSRLAGAATFDYTKNFQSINADCDFDISKAESAAVREYDFQALGGDVIVTLQNGNFVNNQLSPSMAVASGKDTILIRENDRVKFTKIDATHISVSF